MPDSPAGHTVNASPRSIEHIGRDVSPQLRQGFLHAFDAIADKACFGEKSSDRFVCDFRWRGATALQSPNAPLKSDASSDILQHNRASIEKMARDRLQEGSLEDGEIRLVML